MFSNPTVTSTSTLKEFIESFSPLSSEQTDFEFDLDPFLSATSDLSIIECSTQVLQSLAFIAGYSTHKYLKHSKPCNICQDLLTIDKDSLIDELPLSQYKLLELSDRGNLKYPSELVLESIVIAWKIFFIIENNSELMSILVQGPSRKILVDLTLKSIADYKLWMNICSFCAVRGCHILHRLVFVSANCFLANKVKNYNSMVISKGMEKRKLKKFH